MKYLNSSFREKQKKSIESLPVVMNWKPALMVFIFLPFAFSSCLKVDENINPDMLTNQQRMQQLGIKDALIWNSLANQTIELPTDENSMTKSAQVVNIQEYPKGGDFYFALFEDLFPSEGDYDFNDVMIKSKLGLSGKGGEITGYVKSTLINRGGSLPVEIGLMFYKVEGKKYTRIPNKNITINDETLPAEGKPWSIPIGELGDSWNIDFSITHNSANVWINYFIKTKKGEIMTSGFAPSDVEEFTLPHRHYLTKNNLPWGLEIETDQLAVTNEKELFLNAFPEFEEWAKSGGVKNKKWFKSPDPKYTWAY